MGEKVHARSARTPTRRAPTLRLVAPRHSAPRLGVSSTMARATETTTPSSASTSSATTTPPSHECEILGNRLDFRIDPQRLNEAGVVWDAAVRALAEAVAPELRRRAARHGRVTVLELGAGTGALGVGLAAGVEGCRSLVTDLEPVGPLMRANADDAARLGRLARDSAVECEALAWAEEAEIPTPNAFVGDGDGDGDARSRGWDLVAGCEILYWGGWDIFDEDTRAPLLATMRRACALGRIPGDGDKDGDDSAELALAFTVRDKGRETGFVLDGVGEHFWLRVIPGDGDGDGDGDGVLNRARLDAEARAAVAAAREGDLLLLGGRLKDPNP